MLQRYLLTSSTVVNLIVLGSLIYFVRNGIALNKNNNCIHNIYNFYIKQGGALQNPKKKGSATNSTTLNVIYT